MRERLPQSIPFVRRRGPDGEATQDLSGDGWMYAARLAFQDPRPVANQPFRIPQIDGWLAYNGEVFNLQSLRTELSTSTRLQTRSDTEVFAYLLADRNLEFLSRVDGPFAFAFWDGSRRQLLLGRDPQGRKPLYVASQRGSLIFGSDANAVATLSNARPQLNAGQVADFLLLGFQGPRDSGFSGVTSLEPGEVLAWDAHRQSVEEICRLALPPVTYVDSGPWSSTESGKLREGLVEATVARASGEPVALSLSGGLDSTSVALAAAETAIDLHAFTIDWPSNDKQRYRDDADAATLIATRLGLPLDVVPGPRPAEIPELLSGLRHLLSGPNANPTSLTQLTLQREIRSRGMRITLTGDGADEIFLGYPRYRSINRLSSVRLPSIPGSRYLLRSGSGGGRASRYRVAAGRALARESTPEAALSWHWIFAPKDVERIVGCQPPALKWSSRPNNRGRAREAGPIASQAQWDRETWLALESNSVSDAISMGTGGEIRTPFQSPTFLERIRRHPVPVQPHLGQKPLLLQAFPELVDLGVLRRKGGFVSPAGDWMRGNQELVRDCVQALQESGFATGGQGIADRVFAHQSVEGDVRKLWALTVLAHWLDR